MYNPEEPLSAQESHLAVAMARSLGGTALADRQPGTLYFSGQRLAGMAESFRDEPTDFATAARRELREVASNPNHLSQRLDAYIDLTVKLDKAAFPPNGQVQYGTPEYVPHGFVDMGPHSTLGRGPESFVDKAAILTKYKPLLMKVFSHNYSGMSSKDIKAKMVDLIGQGVYDSMPYNHGLYKAKGTTVDLSKMDEGVCRHHNVVAQVLWQAVGIKTKPLYAYVTGASDQRVAHAANAVRINNQWHIYDVTYPDLATKRDGTTEWHPGKYLIDQEPPKGGTKTYDVTAPYSGTKLKYEVHDYHHWRVEDISSKTS